MMRLQQSITWGEVSVISGIIGAMILGCVFVLEIKAANEVIAERQSGFEKSVAVQFGNIALQQTQQDERIQKLSDLMGVAIRNQTVVVTLLKERTGKDVPQELEEKR